MEQHPIPQQISSYQFRLVGDMTLKQFFQVAGGALVALLFYATNLHPIVKWPIIIFSFSLGLALAFLPFEERPLSQWIFSFFRSVYSPTVHLWQKSKGDYAFFKEEPLNKEVEDKTVIAPHGEIKLEEYLKENPTTKSESSTKLDREESSFLQKIASLFAFPTPTKESEVVQQTPDAVVEKPVEIVIPHNKPVPVAPQTMRPKIVVEERLVAGIEELKPKAETTRVTPTLKTSDIKSEQAQFSTNAAPPLPPTIPNTIVGQVMDNQGKIIDGAILEIRDMGGRPVRALRSNKAGHFIIVTALQNGFYEILPEKEGYQFDPVSFETKGEIIPPIAIRAKNSILQN